MNSLRKFSSRLYLAKKYPINFLSRSIPANETGSGNRIFKVVGSFVVGTLVSIYSYTKYQTYFHDYVVPHYESRTFPMFNFSAADKEITDKLSEYDRQIFDSQNELIGTTKLTEPINVMHSELLNDEINDCRNAQIRYINDIKDDAHDTVVVTECLGYFLTPDYVMVNYKSMAKVDWLRSTFALSSDVLITYYSYLQYHDHIYDCSPVDHHNKELYYTMVVYDIKDLYKKSYWFDVLLPKLSSIRTFDVGTEVYIIGKKFDNKNKDDKFVIFDTQISDITDDDKFVVPEFETNGFSVKGSPVFDKFGFLVGILSDDNILISKEVVNRMSIYCDKLDHFYD